MNHCRVAQDLFLQTLTEWLVALAIVAEPYHVPNHPRWFGDSVNSVAIYWSGGQGDPPCSKLHAEAGIVVVEWGNTIIVGCYISPNCSLIDYDAYLDRVEGCVRRYLPRPVLVLGDFNARARAWGNILDNARGRAVLDWAAGLDLRLLNQGSVSTCVRWQGESIVDLSWATPSATRLVSGWRVAEEIVTLSDHRHIILDVTMRLPTTLVRGSARLSWALKRLDRDKLLAAAHVADWGAQSENEEWPSPEQGAAWFRSTMTDVCDAAMPRVTKPSRQPIYWWSEQIAQLRVICLAARRQYTRTRRRRRATPEEKAQSYAVYREATMALQNAIADAKSRSWDELLRDLNRDPWGRPYKIVLGKLRPWTPPLTETLEPGLTRRVVDTLFPLDPAHNTADVIAESQSGAWSEEMEVSQAELKWAVKRLAARNTAPGPDGIPGRAWVIAMEALGHRLARLFSSCLRYGCFPAIWKEAKLVLLRKEGRPADSPSAYRPICLLDDVSKLFERIVSLRINRHLSSDGPNLSDNQFGFRQGRSTVDAILRVRALSEQAISRGRVVLTISLDIVNAFNSLPWSAIRRALVYHQLPSYLRTVIGAYLSGRSIRYPGRNGADIQRDVECGVPQGSVLGPLLWNLAYDAVLRAVLPNGISVVCYADDTLVLAEGDDFMRTTRLAELGVAVVVNKIRSLGLTIAPHKTDALWLHGLRRGREPPVTSVRVGEAEVQVGQFIKYLGLTLDGRWSFDEHFNRLVPRIQRTVGALHRLLPNLGGPEEGVRRLYAGVVRSIALYGAPVWSDRLTRNRRSRSKVLAVQRRIAIRVARGYRTISYEAAALLARFPPLDILAEMDAQVYNALRAEGSVSEDEIKAFREDAHRQAIIRWRERLGEPGSTRQRIVTGILPHFDQWLERKGRVTYRLTQVLTGHGCFGEYLHRIGKERTARCHHCCSELDSAQHTLEECPAWHSERQVLVQEVGQDLSPTALIAAMLTRSSAWNAAVTFCEGVMVQKETAERERERTDPARRRRRRR